MAYWAAAAQAAGEIGTAWINSSSQHKANRMNLQIARENQRWTERMSNTAIQRRQKDIIAAGGNPALAFTGGGEASTPTLSPARMEAARIQAPNLASALQTAENIKNTRANTALQEAQAREATVKAKNAEKWGPDNAMYEAFVNRANATIAVTEGDLAKFKHDLVQEEAEIKMKILRDQQLTTAVERKKAEETVDQLIQMVKQNADTGKIEYEALKAVADLGLKNTGPFWQLLTSILTSYIHKD